MSSPESLTLVRHGESAFNSIRTQRESDPLYHSFVSAFEGDPESAMTIRLANELKDMFPVNYRDFDTPLTEMADVDIKTMARNLSERIVTPDVIFTSPYARSITTLEYMIAAWPELGNKRIVVDERLRERDHGMSLLYFDWRIFAAIKPEERKLREMQGKYWYRLPNGENIPDLRIRTDSWLFSLSENHPDQNVIAISHYLPILAVRASLEEFDSKEFERLDREDEPINAGVTVYRKMPDSSNQAKLQLQSYNMKLY